MGVVVQSMVPAQSSGVLFTCDPLSGNPSIMNINTSFGLGEAIVSGTTDPDTVTLTRSWDDKIAIKSKTVGGKAVRLDISEDGGTKEVKVEKTNSDEVSVTDEILIQLGEIGVLLEKCFASPRDIEWAVSGNKIYLLQARPVTTTNIESDWELLHEFDSPVATEKEWHTTCNIGEMMPGAVTPLTRSVFFRGINQGIQMLHYRNGLKNTVQPHLDKVIESTQLTGFLNFTYIGFGNELQLYAAKKHAVDLAVCGRIVHEMSQADLYEYHGKAPLCKRIANLLWAFWLRYQARDYALRWEKKLETYDIPRPDDAYELWKEIDKRYADYVLCWCDTICNSGVSAMWNSVITDIIMQGKEEFTEDHFADLALMLSSCEDVYSADVPTALKKLAKTIHDSEEGNKFANMTVEDALSWVTNEQVDRKVRNQWDRFMIRHGHRGIREAEMRELSWRRAPTQVIEALQATVKSMDTDFHAHEKEVLDVNQTIDQLRTSLGFTEKKILEFILPKARKAVGSREWGKSLSIKMSDIFKEAYIDLAELMKKEGRLPEQDLIYFFSHQEIGKLLRTRSAKMISKAIRRKKLFQTIQSQLEYPEMVQGHPEPLVNLTKDLKIGNSGSSVKLTGMPVSRGTVRGKARVVKNLDDAHAIQTGDILIVPYTDVGWSPYFPLISGLVTEIGGVISHGAVVAREYGLPCIVSCKQATKIIHTGDEVILDGSAGVIEKIENSSSSSSYEVLSEE